jgi:hypothetical protein
MEARHFIPPLNLNDLFMRKIQVLGNREAYTRARVAVFSDCLPVCIVAHFDNLHVHIASPSHCLRVHTCAPFDCLLVHIAAPSDCLIVLLVPL